MTKAVKSKTTKPRSKEYEKKVSFNGTFEDMVVISSTGAGSKKKEEKKKK